MHILLNKCVKHTARCTQTCQETLQFGKYHFPVADILHEATVKNFGCEYFTNFRLPSWDDEEIVPHYPEYNIMNPKKKILILNC